MTIAYCMVRLTPPTKSQHHLKALYVTTSHIRHDLFHRPGMCTEKKVILYDRLTM